MSASYELRFSHSTGPDDVVVVHATSAIGPSGSPVYRDDTGIIQVEINEECEARVLLTSARQRPRQPSGCRRL
ncbi:DUF6296 family protein [Streptacidiphilus rugosus]|uniref:DUF6296 family protein n=1 Tax=Streptacidiphilus rugosus TaxID=405783 RepID=UPI0005601B17|nr:DUF6296 family protein [Streptacidiphilus rugosus]